MKKLSLSFNTRKSLCNHLGDAAGNELAEFLQQLACRLQTVERSKVDVTPVVPDTLTVPAASSVDSELRI